MQFTGTVYFPHPDCEPVYLVFNDHFHLEDATKTHFAPSSTHVTVIELLRAVAPHFATLDVHDEGEYWESSHIEALEEAKAVINSRLDQIMLESPGSVRFIKERNGRIVDLYCARTPEAARALAEAFGPESKPTEPKPKPWWRTLLPW